MCHQCTMSAAMTCRQMPMDQGTLSDQLLHTLPGCLCWRHELRPTNSVSQQAQQQKPISEGFRQFRGISTQKQVLCHMGPYSQTLARDPAIWMYIGSSTLLSAFPRRGGAVLVETWQRGHCSHLPLAVTPLKPCHKDRRISASWLKRSIITAHSGSQQRLPGTRMNTSSNHEQWCVCKAPIMWGCYRNKTIPAIILAFFWPHGVLVRE